MSPPREGRGLSASLRAFFELVSRFGSSLCSSSVVRAGVFSEKFLSLSPRPR